MAIRRWYVAPDYMAEMPDGREVAVVSRDAMIEAAIEAVTLIARAGGVVSLLPGRADGAIDGEMLTTGLIVEWKDRTDAKAQPEPALQVAPAPTVAPESNGNGDAVREALDQLPPEARAQIVASLAGVAPEPAVAPAGLAADVVGDGLDVAALEEEDLSSIPAGQR